MFIAQTDDMPWTKWDFCLPSVQHHEPKKTLTLEQTEMKETENPLTQPCVPWISQLIDLLLCQGGRLKLCKAANIWVFGGNSPLRHVQQR